MACIQTKVTIEKPEILFNNMKVTDFHIRPSNSKKQKGDKYVRTIFFMMVNEYLISFMDGLSETKKTMPSLLKNLIKKSQKIPRGMKFVS